MGILNALSFGIFASRVCNALIDLGINPNRLDSDCRQMLHEVEKTKHKELSPHEAAAYFFGCAFPYLRQEFFLLPISRIEMAIRS